ncbi:MAG: gyrase subunit A protein [Candidatus Azambacteria bacterium GW2011_GWA1_44_9]|uniref:DNA topoisomerase (ATP-hydrolyzing) n=1 Tax=Candidatus Azambacteria bacterium GW2011_GWA1_44_9 TaxID=1618610 RepID=A0A0G1KE27_9BACT|nr:MAG: gyrase subunit A protein [Candidatus Azambacteria bacterium GW2011_GWA1_44_9]
MARKEGQSKSAGEAPLDAERVSIVPMDISKEMRDSYLDYAMSVITSRALPDARDGLKPVHRRILFSMHEMGLTASAKFRKSAAVVGDVLGKYHPHGDSSVYDAMVKLAQEFATRYPLVIGQGNFGSIDGDSPAAMRYTEAKMSRVSAELLRDLEKETVDFRTLGIAVGMATNIPPHNLGELVDATIHLIDEPQATSEDLLAYVKGPDFPTGGIVFGEKDMHHAYTTGRGGVVVRGEAEIIDEKNTSQIIITSLPYRVNKAELIVKIADLVREKKLEGIRGLRDESTRDIRVVIDLKNGAYPQAVLNFLYKHTDLENSFHYNMVALVDGVPQTLSLKGLLSTFIGHRQVVVRRRTEYDLRKAEEREHILLGLKKALDHIDRVITIIRGSKDTVTAKVNLIKEFKFSDIQAVAILEMRLQKLAGLERKNVELELKEKQEFIKECKELLASPKKILTIVKKELGEVKEKYGDARKSRVVKHGAQSISLEDMIPDEESMLVYTKGGYVKRTNPSEYRKQNRGGVGVVDLNTKDEDFITLFMSATTHSDMLFFSDRGKAYQIKMYDIPEGKRATRGKSIMNFIALSGEEKVTSILAMPKSVKEGKLALFMVTKQGTIKKSSAESFKDVRRSGIISIKLDQGDELLAALFTEKGDDIILTTAKGQAIRFKESDVREMGRTAGGVRGMKLGKNDFIIGADVVKKDAEKPELLVMSENGYGKKTAIKEYKIQKRGGSGIKTAKITAKIGALMTAKVVTPAYEELVAISKKAQVIRIDIKDVPTLGRDTQGVRIMKLYEGDGIASLTCL